MIAVMEEPKTKLHPLKFTLWIGLASIVMMFAGFSSAYIVKSNQTNWLSFEIPLIFWYSTAVIMISSVTMLLCKKAFREREMKQYKRWLAVTTLLGIAFVFLQYEGFQFLWASGITLTRNVSFSFLYIIVGLHAVHVMGGIVALVVMYLRSMSVHRKSYSPVPVDMMNTYWHFVDFLWLYLLIFLIMIR